MKPLAPRTTARFVRLLIWFMPRPTQVPRQSTIGPDPATS
jgi:hypothetical protein